MARRSVPSCSSIEIRQWHERDRNHVHAVAQGRKRERTVAQWWDDDVHSMIQDGFFKTRGPFPRAVDPESVRGYLRDVGLCRNGGLAGARRRKR